LSYDFLRRIAPNAAIPDKPKSNAAGTGTGAVSTAKVTWLPDWPATPEMKYDNTSPAAKTIDMPAPPMLPGPTGIVVSGRATTAPPFTEYDKAIELAGAPDTFVMNGLTVADTCAAKSVAAVNDNAVEPKSSKATAVALPNVLSPAESGVANGVTETAWAAVDAMQIAAAEAIVFINIVLSP